MPDLNADTKDLLDQFSEFMLQQEVANLVQELKDRVIKANDADDTAEHRGGIRPEKAPRN